MTTHKPLSTHIDAARKWISTVMQGASPDDRFMRKTVEKTLMEAYVAGYRRARNEDRHGVGRKRGGKYPVRVTGRFDTAEEAAAAVERFKGV